MKPLDITGERYGSLVAVRNTRRKNKNGCYIWEFDCDCGNKAFRDIGNLRAHHKAGGKAMCNSCKPLHISKLKTIHGKSCTGSKCYKSWAKIKERCLNPTDKGYPNYGGKGISMYEPWVNDFQAFLDYIGEPPDDGKKYSVDRIDNSKGYLPDNIRWATCYQQARNKNMLSNNTSGVTGVRRDDKKWKTKNGEVKVNSYYKTTYISPDGRYSAKCFSIDKLGEELAFFCACEYRELVIEKLNLLGAGYSENHGKKYKEPEC